LLQFRRNGVLLLLLLLLIIIIIIIIITQWSRILLEKLTVTQLVKKFPTFYVIRRFITVLTTASH